MNSQAIVRIKTCCRVSENFVRNFVFLCICCNFRLSILGFLVSAGHAFVKNRPLLLSTLYKTRNETGWLMGNIYVSSKFPFISLYREHVKISQLSTCEKKNTKLIYRKWPHKRPGRNIKTVEYPLHQLIHLGRLEIHIALWNPSINVRILALCYCVVIVSLSLL